MNYQSYIKKFINQNKNSPSIIMLIGEIQNPMDFKHELMIIKNIVQEKFEKQKYLKEVDKLLDQAKQQEDYIFNWNKFTVSNAAHDLTPIANFAINLLYQ